MITVTTVSGCKSAADVLLRSEEAGGSSPSTQTMEIKPGSVVRLINADQPMTVDFLEPPDNVACLWFEKDDSGNFSKLKRKVFKNSELERHPMYE